jgi:methionyl-tRNA formyltransferase
MRLVFIGTGEIGVPTLHALLKSARHQLAGVVTQPDKPAGRDQELRAPPIKTAIARSAVPIFQPARIRASEAIEQIRALNPEVIVAMAYGQILPKTVLDIPRVACLNLHASLLPKYRGAAPIQAAIAAGDRETGITVMYVDEGLDTGDILMQSRIDVPPNETGSSLHDRLGKIAAEALIESLDLLSKGAAPRIPQDDALASYAAKLTRDQGKIDWTEPAIVIERKIRAFDPWPGTFMLLDGPGGRSQKLKIFRASVVPGEQTAPGKILRADQEGILIGAKSGAVLVGEVQLEGKRRMRAAEFVHGHPGIVPAGK